MLPVTELTKKQLAFKSKPYATWRIIGILIVLGFFAVRFNVWTAAVNSNRKESQDLFSSNITNRDDNLERRFNIYTNGLYSGRSLFLVDNSVSRSDWNNYISGLNIQQLYPGVYGTAYVSVVNADQEKNLVNQLNANRYANETKPITIFPNTNTDNSRLAIVTYMSPESTAKNSIGYNLYADPTRTEAMDKARDSGEPQATRPLALVSSKSSAAQNLLLVMPVYNNFQPTVTVAERQAALKGFVVMALHTKPLLDSVFQEPYQNSDIAVSISTNGKTIYQSGPRLTGNVIKQAAILNIGGQTWQLNYRAPDTLGLGTTAKLTPTLLLLSLIPLLTFYLLAFYFSIRYYGLRRHYREHHSNDQSAGHNLSDALK